LITHSDEGPDSEPEDELTVLLRPPAHYLGAPPGRYEAIRRGASRRRAVRAAVGAALTCGVAALIVLPLRLTATTHPATPTIPMAPPPASSPATPPSRTPTPEPSGARPGRPAQSARTLSPSEAPIPTSRTGAYPAPSARVPSLRPTPGPSGIRSTPTTEASPSPGR
jgi:hypothetical protein